MILFTLAEIMVLLVVIGLLVGVVMSVDKVVQISRLRAQVTQIEHYDEAVAEFYEKYGGLPGDLLSVVADREGIPAGDGTPSHSDGDGKISPCNPGWQHHLGCETALFWSQLSETGFIAGDFNADNRLSDERLLDVTVTMSPYLPLSPLGDGIYVAVWNTDAEQPSVPPQLPYGNYFEISRIRGIKDGQFQDSPNALTPSEAQAIDNKIDDGSPIHGRITVNGNAKWPDDPWGTYAKPGTDVCVNPDDTYNTQQFLLSGKPLCHLAVAFKCCVKQKDK